MDWKYIIHLVITLSFGFMLGVTATGGFASSKGPEHHPKGPRINHFAEQFDLTDQQRERVEDIVRNQREKMRGFRKAIAPQMRRLHEETRAEIRELLSPEQQRKFDEIHHRKERHRAQRKRRRGGKEGRRGMGEMPLPY